MSKDSSGRHSPLLMICVPTCNRSGFLKIMLQALVPQLQEFQGLVTAVILDNASTDDTADVMLQYADNPLVHYFVQPQNCGANHNIVHGPTYLSEAEFSWVLGDHNLLHPGALQTIVARLQQNSQLDIYYVNFHIASYPDQWPTKATQGYAGPFLQVGHQTLGADNVNQWHLLLTPQSAFCTQNYVHIVRTDVWQSFWKQNSFSRDYVSAISTYPHTWMVVNECFHKPAGVFQLPLLTIFEGAQSWSATDTRTAVYLNGLPELLQKIRELLDDPKRTETWTHSWVRPLTLDLLRSNIRSKGFAAMISLLCQSKLTRWQRLGYLCGLWWYRPGCLTRKLAEAIRTQYDRRHQTFLWNCRPARWWRRS